MIRVSCSTTSSYTASTGVMRPSHRCSTRRSTRMRGGRGPRTRTLCRPSTTRRCSQTCITNDQLIFIYVKMSYVYFTLNSIVFKHYSVVYILYIIGVTLCIIKYSFNISFKMLCYEKFQHHLKNDMKQSGYSSSVNVLFCTCKYFKYTWSVAYNYLKGVYALTDVCVHGF